MSWHSEYFRSAEARDAADRRKREEERRGSGSIRVLSTKEAARVKYEGADAFDLYLDRVQRIVADGNEAFRMAMLRIHEYERHGCDIEIPF